MATAIHTASKMYANPVVKGLTDIQEGEVAFVEESGELDFIDKPILALALKINGLDNQVSLKLYSPFKLSPTAEGLVSCRILKNGSPLTPVEEISGMDIVGNYLTQSVVEDNISTFTTLLNPYEYLETASTPTDLWKLEFTVENAYGLRSARAVSTEFKNVYTFSRASGMILSGSEIIPSTPSFTVSAGEFLRTAETLALDAFTPPGAVGYHWRLESSVWVKSANVQNVVDATYYSTATDRTEMTAGWWSTRHIYRSVFNETCFWVYGDQYETQVEAEAEVQPSTTGKPADIKRAIYVGKVVIQKNTDPLNAARSFVSMFS